MATNVAIIAENPYQIFAYSVKRYRMEKYHIAPIPPTQANFIYLLNFQPAT